MINIINRRKKNINREGENEESDSDSSCSYGFSSNLNSSFVDKTNPTSEVPETCKLIRCVTDSFNNIAQPQF